LPLDADSSEAKQSAASDGAAHASDSSAETEPVPDLVEEKEEFPADDTDDLERSVLDTVTEIKGAGRSGNRVILGLLCVFDFHFKIITLLNV